jgi:hypothetical protein
MDGLGVSLFKVNGNAYCHKAHSPSNSEERTYKFNKSTKQWQVYQINLEQFFENFKYLFSYAHYVYGVAHDKRVGMININTGQFRWMASFPGVYDNGNGDMIAVTIGSDGYVLGGSEYVELVGERSVDQYWKYDIIRDRWTDLGGLPDGGRSRSSAFVVGTKIYYGLGFQGEHDSSEPDWGDTYSNDWFALDPSNNTYSRLSNFPGEARAEAKGFVINGKVCVGWGATIYVNGQGWEGQHDFWEFDPVGNRWTEKANPGPTFSWGRAFSLDNTGYILSFSDDDAFWRYGNLTDINP